MDMNRFEQGESWMDGMKSVKSWANVERNARNACITLIVILAAFVGGQFTVASAMSSATVEGSLNAWASSDPAKTLAVANLRQCQRTGPSLTEAGCIEQAAPGALGKSLSDEMHRAQTSALRGTPAPLSWFLK